MKLKGCEKDMSTLSIKNKLSQQMNLFASSDREAEACCTVCNEVEYLSKGIMDDYHALHKAIQNFRLLEYKIRKENGNNCTMRNKSCIICENVGILT